MTTNQRTGGRLPTLLCLALGLGVGDLGCTKSKTLDAMVGNDGSVDKGDLPSPGGADGGLDLGVDVGKDVGKDGGVDISVDIGVDIRSTGLDGGDGGLPRAPTLCAITATLTPVYPDAGPTAMPAEHKFTLVIDWAANTATTGSGGTAQQVALVESNGIWTTQATLSLSLSLSLALSGNSGLDRPRVTYKAIKIRPTADGCEGEGSGDYLWNSSDMLFDFAFTATLTGVGDKEGPTLAVIPAAATNVHPLALSGVAANELLPVATIARWVAAVGVAVDMAALPVDGSLGVSGFSFANRAFAFGTTYHLEFLPDARDVAGNSTSDLPSITTLADPGMFAMDGFEGALNAYVGGQVKIVDHTALPIPGGHKALRFAPTTFSVGVDWSCQDRFTARLAVPSGATTVKLSYLEYWPKTGNYTPIWASMHVAVPNGAVVEYSVGAGTITTLPSPWTGALPGSADFTYGELKQLELPVPVGAASEVMFDLDRECSEPSSPGHGLIVDDLRVE
jgi:hypothetical protein